MAEAVAAQVPKHPGPAPLVLALPRGGVPVAVRVAARIGAELDIVLVRKIGAPGHEEYGVGAMAEDGPPVFDEPSLLRLGLTTEGLAEAVDRQRVELGRRVRKYRGTQPPPDPAGREVVVVDDGLATGVTARAALQWLRGHHPVRLVLATPVCAPGAGLSVGADTVICLSEPPGFRSVGQWYENFEQLTDADVERWLRSHVSDDMYERT
ncbi:phosphoribosyltransferase [Actinoplanes sp. TRM 88003]|uniref:Phosphoribosyltransferase n=1 Tax=Paractinoplanes aksuensis TaxID=2939490 RepID=A0ABT1DKU4_9ACTN|nr:phosphoribosyltransferase family protein [Actinoplanes aksuensis]MCO8271123.1 phosphoribosyltransferase [Actinoplanes aksuensis]